MITASQQDYINDHAYIPEHIPQYVTAISQTEPFLIDDFLVHVKKDHLTFVGYPLKEPFEEKRIRSVLEKGIKRFRPESVSLFAPSIPSSIHDCIRPPSDHYYRLELSSLSISQKLRNMLSRAGRELFVKKNKDFDEEHRKIVEDFLNTRPVDEATRFIFRRIGDYLFSSPTAWAFDARNNRGELVAFDVAEFIPMDYILYMFNFSSEARYVPGASDLLLSEVIKQARTESKKYINLGLGINPGVTFFKKKWRGVPFLPYASCFYHLKRKENLDALLQKL